MAPAVSALIDDLERLRTRFGAQAAAEKRSVLLRLERRSVPEPGDIERLHESLCFLRAYPDDADVLTRVERMLARFETRADVRRNRRWLEQTGIGGTLLQFPFFWETARWMARRWPERLVIDWDWWDRAKQARLAREVLPLLVPYSETPALDAVDLTAKEWLARLKGPDETDATFLIRRFERVPGDPFTREALYDSLDVALICRPGEHGPSRTCARYPPSPVSFRTRDFDRARPDLRRELGRRPAAVRKLTPREADRAIDLTREAMVTRLRDLYSFSYPDRDDVHVVDYDDGLQFVCIGTLPERRLMFEAVYGFLTLMNGVPIGYVLASSLFESSEIAYNVFETFRSGEAARVFSRVLAMTRHLFGARSFSIDPYQLGYGNEEGLRSGAWWFYAKLGFRPEDPATRELFRRERAAIRDDPGHRTDLGTLERLASTYLYLRAGSSTSPPLGALALGNLGLRIADLLRGRGGAERERTLRTCAEEAAGLLGLSARRRLTRAQKLWWERWSPLVLALPGVRRWSAENRRRLAEVILAKGGPSEREFVRRFDAHAPLRRSVVRLAEDDRTTRG
jgi:hypothetical protein